MPELLSGAIVGWLTQLAGDTIVSARRNRRRLSEAVAAAVETVLSEIQDVDARESLRMALREWFTQPPLVPYGGDPSLKRRLTQAVSRQLDPLADPDNSIGDSSYLEQIGVSHPWLTDRLTEAIVAAIKQVASAADFSTLATLLEIEWRDPDQQLVDIERLRAHTEANLPRLAEALSMTIPEGGQISLFRTAVQGRALAFGGTTAISGDAGVGKTAILHEVAVTTMGAGADVVLLRASNLRATSGDTRVELGLAHELGQVLTRWSGNATGLLLIDGLDQTRSEDVSGWLPDLAAALADTRWRIVATIRAFDLRYSERWRRMFSYDPTSSTSPAPDLAAVRHVMVTALTDEELSPLRDASPRLSALLDNADDQLRQLLINPYNLNLAACLLAGDGGVDLSTVRSRDDLLSRYWRQRVGSPLQDLDQQRALKLVVDRMVSTRRQSIDTLDLPAEVSGQTLHMLCSKGVLRDQSTNTAHPTAVLEFTHPILFDYAVARLALGDIQRADSLAERLDDEPNLVITVRPSLDYRLALAWDAETLRDGFWNLALRLASREAGHVLAALAAAGVASRQLRTSDDCSHLTDACSKAVVDPYGRWDASDAHNLAFLLAAVLSRGQAVPEAIAIVAQMSATLAGRARSASDVELAILAAQLPLRAATGPNRVELTAAAGGHVVRVAVDCLRLALEDRSDPRRAALAQVASRLLPDAMAVDPTACDDLAERLCAGPIIQAWGTQHLWVLVDRIADIAATAPSVAVTLGAAVWEYEETSDEQTTLLDSAILGMTSTRKQDLEGLRYHVATRFGALASVDLVAATQVLIRIVDAPRMLYSPERITFDVPPRPRVGRSLRYSGGHDALAPMADAVLSRLVDLTTSADSDGDAQPWESLTRAVGLLVSDLRHDEVWKRLLLRAARAESSQLAWALLPALTVPNLYAHPTTWAAGGQVAARLSPLLPAEDHARLETAILDMVDIATQAYENDTTYRDHWQEQRDMLLRSLSPNSIVSQVVRQRLADLPDDRDPRPLPELAEDPLEDMGLEDMGEIIQPVRPPDEASLHGLHERLQSARRQARNGNEDDRRRAQQQLVAMWRQVMDMDFSGSVGGSAVALHKELTVDLAEALAHVPEVAPGGRIGMEVYQTLSSHLPPAGAGSDGHAPRSGWADMETPTWATSTTTSALTGLAVFVWRDDWRSAHGNELRDLLLPLLDDHDPVYRFQATRILPLLLDQPGELLAELERRLAAETDRHVATVLLDHLWYGFLRSPPKLADDLLKRLGRLPQWQVLTTDVAGDDTGNGDNRQSRAVRLLTVLAARYEAPYARTLLAAWLTDPLAHPNRAVLATTKLRDALNPADHRLRPVQQRTFQLYASCATVLRDTWLDHPQHSTDPVHQDRLAGVVRVAGNLAEQIYFASGAHEGRMSSKEPTPRGDPGAFAASCLPVLELLSSISYPGVTHHLVQTLNHIRRQQPVRALQVASQAVANDSGFARDQLGRDATLTMIRSYLADHRSVTFSDPTNISNLRILLEAFVRTGWDQAIDLAETVTELFQ